MATTFEALATVTVGSGGAASIDFSSIPASYTDLLLVLSGRGTVSATYSQISLKLNNSTSSFTNRELYADGSSVGSYTGTNGLGYMDGANATANTFSNMQIYIPNYAGSTNKSYSVDNVYENNATFAEMGLYAGLWSNTAAINQVTVYTITGNFAQYSTATLYGIKNS